jgi:hypothetical protein
MSRPQAVGSVLGFDWRLHLHSKFQGQLEDNSQLEITWAHRKLKVWTECHYSVRGHTIAWIE